MKITIIILNYNGKADTAECLNSIKNLEHNNFDLDTVMVDNASTDGSPECVKNNFPEIRLLINSQNLGYAEGNNVGIKYALEKEADFVWLLNNDTYLAADCLVKLLEAAAKEPKAGIFGPKIYFAKGLETHKDRYKKEDLGRVIWYAGGKIDWDNMIASHRGVDEADHGQFEEMIKTSFVSGCSMLIRKEVFNKVGFYDKKFFLYYEDVDFCMRARKKGFEVIYVPDAHMWHKNAGSSGGTGSDTHVYYQSRNRMIVGIRYAPWKTKLALYREAMNLLFNGTPTQKQAIGDFLRKKYGPRKPLPLTEIQIPRKLLRLPKWPKMPALPKMPGMPKWTRVPRFPQMPNLWKIFKKNAKSKNQSTK